MNGLLPLASLLNGVRTRSFIVKDRRWRGSLGWHDCLAQQVLQSLKDEEALWSRYVDWENSKMKKMSDRERRFYIAERPEHLDNGMGYPSIKLPRQSHLGSDLALLLLLFPQ